MLKLSRLKAVKEHYGRSRTSIYQDIQDGLFVPPIKMGERCSAWPDYEVDAIIQARIAGKSVNDIKLLVAKLVADRSRQVA